jgi:hypothetical protein
MVKLRLKRISSILLGGLKRRQTTLYILRLQFSKNILLLTKKSQFDSMLVGQIKMDSHIWRHHVLNFIFLEELTEPFPNYPIWDQRQLSAHIGDTTTLSTSFLDYKGVLGIMLIPVLTEEATALHTPRTPRVHTLMFLVSEKAMETWRSKVAIDSSTAVALSSAMAR